MRLHLPMQGTQVFITGLGRVHMLWTAKPKYLCPGAQEPQLLSLSAATTEPTCARTHAPQQEKSTQ